MTARQIHAEHLVGRTMYDINDQKVGRIEEIEAERKAKGWFVTALVLGEHGLLKRLSFRGIGPLFVPSLEKHGRRRAQVIPWQKIDLSNPKRPRLRCRKEDL